VRRRPGHEEFPQQVGTIAEEVTIPNHRLRVAIFGGQYASQQTLRMLRNVGEGEAACSLLRSTPPDGEQA